MWEDFKSLFDIKPLFNKERARRRRKAFLQIRPEPPLSHAGLVLGGLALFVVVGLGVHLSSPGATPTPPPLADLEADLPGDDLTVVLPTTVEAVEIDSLPHPIAKTVRVQRGDTLMSLLLGEGVDRSEAHLAITALQDVFRPRDLKPGQAIRLALAHEPTPTSDASYPFKLVSLSLQPSVERDILVTREPELDHFVATAIERPLRRAIVGGAGVIETSLFDAIREAGIPAPVMMELIRAFSYDVDFQREVHKTDDFELLYESHYDDEGNLARTGAVIYAALTLSGRRLEIYRFTPKSGNPDYFGPDGRSVRKALLRTPIDGGRISSRFGMRKHPILGYSKMHRGVDFAARTGTPVLAAGDGVIERIGRYGAYGKYVRIRHSGQYRTAYAHLHRFAKDLGKGQSVKQGQVIGYVGTTGRSTGPHLHYEVLQGRRQIDPATIDLPAGEQLAGADLEAFTEERERIDRLRHAAPPATLVAQNDCSHTGSLGEYALDGTLGPTCPISSTPPE